MKHTQELFWHYWVPLLSMLTVITLESTDMMSGAHTGEHLRALFLWLGVHLGEPQLELLNHLMRKCGHALGYGLLCFCWLMMFRGTYWMQHDCIRALRGSIQVRRIWWRVEWAALSIFCTFLVASADELHQMSIPSRTGNWHDVALDTSAAAVSMALVLLKAEWRCREKKPPTAQGPYPQPDRRLA